MRKAKVLKFDPHPVANKVYTECPICKSKSNLKIGSYCFRTHKCQGHLIK